MAIIFYKKIIEENELPVIYPISPKPPEPEIQRYLQLLKEYNQLVKELESCKNITLTKSITPFKFLNNTKEIDYEELSEELSMKIRKIKSEIEKCKKITATESEKIPINEPEKLPITEPEKQKKN